MENRTIKPKAPIYSINNATKNIIVASLSFLSYQLLILSITYYGLDFFGITALGCGGSKGIFLLAVSFDGI